MSLNLQIKVLNLLRHNKLQSQRRKIKRTYIQKEKQAVLYCFISSSLSVTIHDDTGILKSTFRQLVARFIKSTYNLSMFQTTTTLREFKSVLWKISFLCVQTDHRNFTYKNRKNPDKIRVFLWLYLFCSPLMVGVPSF